MSGERHPVAERQRCHRPVSAATSWRRRLGGAAVLSPRRGVLTGRDPRGGRESSGPHGAGREPGAVRDGVGRAAGSGKDPEAMRV